MHTSEGHYKHETFPESDQNNMTSTRVTHTKPILFDLATDTSTNRCLPSLNLVWEDFRDQLSSNSFCYYSANMISPYEVLHLHLNERCSAARRHCYVAEFQACSITVAVFFADYQFKWDVFKVVIPLPGIDMGVCLLCVLCIQPGNDPNGLVINKQTLEHEL